MICFNCNEKCIKDGEPTILAGIINATPDSFSDGGKYSSLEAALERAREMIKDGALMLDIGGESTRPASSEISEDEEIKRISKIISAIRKNWPSIFISVDTWRAKVAEVAISEGADIINDITGLLGDEKMASVIANTKCGLIAMFNPTIMRPEHQGSIVFRKFYAKNPFSVSEQEKLAKLSIVDAMKEYFAKTLQICNEHNILKDRVMLDPGIGFGLTLKENLQLLNAIDTIHEMGHLSFVGVSRKRFVINIMKEAKFDIDLATDSGLQEADIASSFLSSILAFKGANVLRVHSIPYHLKAIMMGTSIRLSEHASDINFAQYKK